MNSAKRLDALKPKDLSLVNVAREGDVQALRELCGEGVNVDYQDSVGASTPLMTAANSGNSDCVEFLLSKGAKIDMQDKDGRTPLIFAVTMTRTECVKVLVLHGADPNRCSKNGWSPLYIACNKGSTEIVEILVNFPYATRHGVSKINIDIPNSVGGTSLMVASMHGHKEIVNILMQQRADVNLRDLNKWNAVMKAADKGNTEVVSVLIEHGADVTAFDNNGFSSLALAAKAGKEATVRALLDSELSKPDINFADKNGRTALFYAAQNGHLEAVRELWSRGADLTIKDKNGNTALSVAKVAAVTSLLQTTPPPYKPPAAAKPVSTTPPAPVPAPVMLPTEASLSPIVIAPTPLQVPSAQSGEKSGDVEGAHVDTLLQTQMGGLTFSSSLTSSPLTLPVVPSRTILAGKFNSKMEVESDEDITRKRKATDSPPTAHKLASSAHETSSSSSSVLQMVEFSKIPAYLHSSELYENFDGDQDDSISVPVSCYRLTDEVETAEDFKHLLNVVMFWSFTKLPPGLMAYCARTDASEWDNAAADILGELSPLYRDLKAVFRFDALLPLPHAIEAKRTELVLHLIELKADFDSTAAVAAAAGSADAVTGLLYLTHLHKAGYPWDAASTAAAALRGNLNCLAYLHEHGCPWDESTLVAAARGDHTECMQFALDHGLNQWSAEVCSAAAEGGHLGCLKFAREKGCPWDDNVTLKATENAPVLATSVNSADPEEARKLEEQRRALEAERFECLQFALLHNCPIHKDACTNAAAGGHLPTLQLLHDRAPPAPWNADTILAAVEAGSLECLTYLHRNRCPWDTRAPEAAAKRGDIACLRYCIGNWCPYDADLMRQAAASPVNGLACLKFLIGEQGMYMNDDGSVFGAVLLRGDVECARYLINFDCPFRSFKYQKGQTWTIVDTATFDDKLSQTITLAYRFGWRWNDAFEAYVKATTTPPLTKCCALIDGRGPPTAVPARTVPTAGGLPWPPSFKPGFSFF